ncbi:hypothetical protein [Dokdonella sp.]|uniref:hypothetical protein n=1 Tax=Dokdonella sp. TaxID=2291710 RepID=UPI003C66594B
MKHWKYAFVLFSVVGIALFALLVLQGGYKDEQVEGEVWAKPVEGDFWAHRVSYPTMQFSPGWYKEARLADQQIQSSIPAGEKNYRRSAQSPLTLEPNGWTFLGPSPLVRLFQNVLTAGRTNAIAVDPRGPDIDGFHTVYAGSNGGGLWKTTNCCDANTTWKNVTDDRAIASAAIGDIYIDPGNPDVIYLGTGDLRYGSLSFGSVGVLKSIDRGESWSVLGEDVFNPIYPPSPNLGFPQYQAISKVRTNPNDPDTIVAGTKTGIFVSNNGGADWTGPCYTNTHLDQRQDVTGLIIQDVGGGAARMFVAIGTRGLPTAVQPDLSELGANGVYRAMLPASGCPITGDWTLLENGWPAGTGNGNPAGKLLGRLEMADAPSEPNTIYAMGVNAMTSSVLGVWRTDDGGDTWTQRAAETDIQSGGCNGGDGGGWNMWYNAALAVDPGNAENVLLSGVDMYRSNDGGSSFLDMTCGYDLGFVHVDHHAQAFLPDGKGGFDSNQVLSGTDGGVFYTANAQFGTGGPDADNRPTYISLNQTIGTIEFYSGDITANFASSPTPGASAGAQDNGSDYVRWSNANPGAAQWTIDNPGDGIYTRIEPINELRWYYSSQNGSLVVTENGPGSQGEWANTGWGGDTLSFVMPFEIYRHGELDVAGSGCTSAIGCTFLIAGTNRVWETVEGAVPAESWYPNSPNLTKNTLGSRSFINQLAYATKNPGVAIVGTNDGNVQFGHALNQGVSDSASWVDLTDGNAVLPNRPVMDVTVDVGDAANPGTSAVGYAVLGGFDENTPSTPGHVYEVSCVDNCATFSWRNVSGNLPNIPTNTIAVNPKNPVQVFAGTDWGLYYTDDVRAADPVWYRFENGMPRVMIWDMAIDRGFTTLAVFTRGRGAWAWPLPDGPIDPIFENGFENP